MQKIDSGQVIFKATHSYLRTLATINNGTLTLNYVSVNYIGRVQRTVLSMNCGELYGTKNDCHKFASLDPLGFYHLILP